MYDTLALSVVVGIIILWIPGFLILKAARVNTLSAFSIAPIISLAVYCALTEIYRNTGVFSNFISVFTPALAIGVSAYIISFLICKRHQNVPVFIQVSGQNNTTGRAYALMATYIIAGCVIASVLFLGNIGSALDFVLDYDNVHHLGSAYTFKETGVWSSFASSSYLSMEESIRPIFNVGGFYPSLWHTLIAMLMSCLDIRVTLAVNSVNFLLVAIVFPASMFFLLRVLFRDELAPLLSGAFVIFAFASFPWKLLLWGPLYPNLMSLVLLPVVCGVAIFMFESNKSRGSHIFTTVLLLICVVVLVFSHTNAVFTMAVFLTPFLTWQASKIPLFEKDASPSTFKRVVFGAGAAIVIGAIWVLFYKLPFLEGVVSYVWKSFTDVPGAISNVLTLSFKETMPQYVLGAVVLVGIISTLFNPRRKYLWLTCSYLIMVTIYVVCATSEGPLKQMLGGFWYTDTIRIAANCALFAMPLACLGLSFIALGLKKLICENALKRQSSDGGHSEIEAAVGIPTSRKRVVSAIQTVIIGAIILIIFLPVGSLLNIEGYEHAFEELSDRFNYIYAPAESFESDERDDDMPRVYNLEEQRFVEEAKKITGDALVVNQPNDGSAYGYSVNDYNNLYFRTISGIRSAVGSEAGRIVRLRLNEIATDPMVKDAVDKLGVKYVLKLDQGDQFIRANPYLVSYNEYDWPGIDNIDDNTPGFEVVLAKDDMRLYKIVD